MGVSLLLLGRVLLYRYLSYEESLEEAGRKCLHYIETGNARALFQYVSDKEKEMLDLDLAKFETFMQFIKSRLNGFSPKGEPKIIVSNELGYHFTRVYSHPDGRTTSLFLSVRPTDRGPKLIPATSYLIRSALYTYVPKERMGEDAQKPLIYGLQKAMSDLKNLPIPGYFETRFPIEKPRLQVWSWEEYAQRLYKQWERATSDERPLARWSPRVGRKSVLPKHRVGRGKGAKSTARVYPPDSQERIPLE